MYDGVLAFRTTFSARHIVAHLFTDRLNVLLLTHHLQLLLHGLRLGDDYPENNVDKHHAHVDIPAEGHIIKNMIQWKEGDHPYQIQQQGKKEYQTRYPRVDLEVGSHPATHTT